LFDVVFIYFGALVLFVVSRATNKQQKQPTTEHPQIEQENNFMTIGASSWRAVLPLSKSLCCNGCQLSCYALKFFFFARNVVVLFPGTKKKKKKNDLGWIVAPLVC
jgi:hypothetical protein